MDPYVIIIVGGLVGLVVALLLLGRFYPGTGADAVDWKPTRSVEQQIQSEIDDLDEMLEAANRRRRARGEQELTEESIRADLAAQNRLPEDVKSRDEQLAELELAQLVEAKNARRRARGEPELTIDEERARLGLEPDA